jgi:predicted deacylase
MTEWIERHGVPSVQIVNELDLEALPAGLHRLALTLLEDALSQPIRLPVIVARGVKPGPVVGLTAAVHGNEINGIRTIHHLFERIDPAELAGTVVGVTVVNVPAYLRNKRRFPDATDLNRIMPGRENGNESQIYAARFDREVLARFQYLIDLHTASFGRVNSLYVRADLTDPQAATLARAIGADIIVHNAGSDGTVRASAANRGITAITVEIGDPQVLDRGKIRTSRIGIRDVLENLGMVPQDHQQASRHAVECGQSYWLHTDTGGLLEVLPEVTARVEAGAPIAHLFDPWGRRLRTYHAPESGIVIGRSSNPVATTGARILHLGVMGPPGPAAKR